MWNCRAASSNFAAMNSMTTETVRLKLCGFTILYEL